MTFNGEIYNHLALRAELMGTSSAPAWRGHSDTETLLASFDAWGLEATAKKAVGMFALAVWDKRDSTLTLARDRFGEKPLYYGWQGDCFLFASELPSLKAHPSFNASVDRNALAIYLRRNCIPAPYSIYQGVSKQLPGTLVRISVKQPEPVSTPYWDLRDAIVAGQASPFHGTAQDAVLMLEKKLHAAVSGQMMSDVPLGAFLSGGVDSSTIVSVMQQLSNRPVNTFTIGFTEQAYDESVHAKAVAKHLGTNHTELIVTPQHAQDVIPRLPTMYGEPFADSSQIPTFLVSQLARQHVTVSLSGDAGDELFAGYNRYVLTNALWNSISKAPRSLRQVSARAIKSVPESRWNKLLGPMQPLMPARLAQANIGGKLVKGAEVLGSRTTRELYESLVTHWNNPNDVVIGATEPVPQAKSVDGLFGANNVRS